MIRVGEEDLLFKSEDNLAGSAEWRTAGAMVADMKKLDAELNKDFAGAIGTFQLKAKEQHLKKKYAMEHPEEVLDLAS